MGCLIAFALLACRPTVLVSMLCVFRASRICHPYRLFCFVAQPVCSSARCKTDTLSAPDGQRSGEYNDDKDLGPFARQARQLQVSATTPFRTVTASAFGNCSSA